MKLFGWHPYHRWETVLDTGVHLYEECEECGKRRVERYNTLGYQPIDMGWLETGKWTPLPSPPPGVISGSHRP